MRCSKEELDEKKMQALEKIDEFIEKNGYPPTCRELCKMMNFTSSSTGYRYLEMLEDDGYIKRMGKGSRNIKRIHTLSANSSIKMYENNNIAGQIVPICGLITAGMPITAVENISGYVSFISSKKFDGELFALKVRGESMIDAGIFDGDLIIVLQTQMAENGDIVVALVDKEEATVKTFYKENGHFRLQPENETMKPIILDEVDILGKVVGLQREF